MASLINSVSTASLFQIYEDVLVQHPAIKLVTETHQNGLVDRKTSCYRLDPTDVVECHCCVKGIPFRKVENLARQPSYGEKLFIRPKKRSLLFSVEILSKEFLGKCRHTGRLVAGNNGGKLDRGEVNSYELLDDPSGMLCGTTGAQG